jgi:vacuolar-type H+-ATPase subunit I/STV1
MLHLKLFSATSAFSSKRSERARNKAFKEDHMQKDHLEILLEDIRGKFDLVLEGHEVLRNEIRETRTELKKDIELSNFKIDILNKKIDGVSTDLKATDERLSKKIDAVAADLKSHRADTEAHHGGVYLVKES